MCFGDPAFLKQMGLVKESEETEYGTHPETGQERYPDRTYNEQSGYDYEAAPNEGQTDTTSGGATKGDGLKGDAPLIDNKKEKGPTPGSSGGGEINY
tara:strand:- start:17 stop:307 length:291 start_codon:yes stop_codon:yes gene_type:complete